MIRNALVESVRGRVVAAVEPPPPGSSPLLSAMRSEGLEQLPTEDRAKDPRLTVWTVDVGQEADSGGGSKDEGIGEGLPGSEGLASVSRL